MDSLFSALDGCSFVCVMLTEIKEAWIILEH